MHNLTAMKFELFPGKKSVHQRQGRYWVEGGGFDLFSKIRPTDYPNRPISVFLRHAFPATINTKFDGECMPKKVLKTILEP